MSVVLECMLLLFLIVCAISATFNKRLLVTVIIYTSYSLGTTLIWALLQSPDLAITEAAVGAGVSSILFFVTLRKLKALQEGGQHEQDKR